MVMAKTNSQIPAMSGPRGPLPAEDEMLMRHHLVQERNETDADDNAGDDNGHRHDPAAVDRGAVIEARNDQREEACREHYAGRESEQRVVQSSRYRAGEEHWQRPDRSHSASQEARETSPPDRVHPLTKGLSDDIDGEPGRFVERDRICPGIQKL